MCCQPIHATQWDASQDTAPFLQPGTDYCFRELFVPKEAGHGKAQSKVVSTVLVSCGAFLGHVRVLMTSSKAFFCPLAWSLFFFGSWCRQSSWHLSVYGRGREELLSVFQSSWCLFLMWKDLWPKKPAVSEPAAWGGAQDWGDTDPAISFWDVAWWESLRLVYLKFSKPFHVTEAVGTSIVECHSNENLVFKKIIQL